MNDFEGRVALITGAAGGLGSSVSGYLAELGATVVVTDLDADRAQATADSILGAGGSAVSAGLDVADSAAVEDLVGRVVADHGRLDVLITSHGFPRDGKLLDMSDDAWSAVVDVCLTGTFYCIRAAARPMTEAGFGRIVTVASRAWHGNPGQANYSAAKAGVVGLTRSVAKELGRSGVTANSIAPGLIDTTSLQGLPTYEQIKDRAIKASSIKRLGEPDDVANAMVFLASPASGFITGEVVHVSGGRYG
jgi:3-oxoacyl-[acyl-carrier protein] reductase